MRTRTPSGFRTCVGCGTRDAQARLVRVQVKEPASSVAGRGDDPVTLSVVAKPGSGRSAYLHDRRECLEGIGKARSLGRSLRVRFGKEDLVRVSAQLLASGRFGGGNVSAGS